MALIDQELSAIRRLSMQELLGILKRANVGYAGPELREYLVDAVADVVTVYGSEVISVTAADLEAARPTPGPLVLPEPMNPAQVEGVVGWALSRTDVQSALAGSVLRLVQNTGRDTVRRSAEAARTRYYRKPNPNACEFCLMLGSRGAVYTSSKRAGVGNSFHDHCRCRVVELHGALPKLNRDLSDLWGDVTADPADGLSARGAWKSYWAEKRKSVPIAA